MTPRRPADTGDVEEKIHAYFHEEAETVPSDPKLGERPAMPGARNRCCIYYYDGDGRALLGHLGSSRLAPGPFSARPDSGAGGGERPGARAVRLWSDQPAHPRPSPAHRPLRYRLQPGAEASRRGSGPGDSLRGLARDRQSGARHCLLRRDRPGGPRWLDRQAGRPPGAGSRRCSLCVPSDHIENVDGVTLGAVGIGPLRSNRDDLTVTVTTFRATNPSGQARTIHGRWKIHLLQSLQSVGVDRDSLVDMPYIPCFQSGGVRIGAALYDPCTKPTIPATPTPARGPVTFAPTVPVPFPGSVQTATPRQDAARPGASGLGRVPGRLPQATIAPRAEWITRR